MKTKFALALSLLIGTAAVAQEITPRWKLEPGKTLRFQQDIKMTIEQKMGESDLPATIMDVTLVFSKKVVKVDDAGKVTLEVCIEKIRQKVDNPMMKVEFDSEKPEDVKNAQDNPQLKPLADIVGRTFSAQIDTRGVVHSVAAPSGPNMIPLEKADFQQMFLGFPEKALKVGDNWVLTTEKNSNGLPVTVKNTYTLKGVEEGVAVFSSDPKLTLHVERAENPMVKQLKMESFEGTGEVRFALEEGVLKTMKASNTMMLTIESPPIVQNIKTETGMKLLPEAE